MVGGWLCNWRDTTFYELESITDRVLSGSDNYEIYEDNVAKLVKYVLED
jgi:hypothetical protein